MTNADGAACQVPPPTGLSAEVAFTGIFAALMRVAAEGLLAMGRSTAHLWVSESNAAFIPLFSCLGALRTERARKDLFGQGVLCARMEWSDLRSMSSG